MVSSRRRKCSSQPRTGCLEINDSIILVSRRSWTAFFFFFFLQKAGQNPLRVGSIDREIFLFQKLEKFNKISRLLVGAILFAASSVINFVIGRVLIWIFIQTFLDFSYFFWERINWFLYLTKIHGNYEFFDGLIILFVSGEGTMMI